MNAWGRHKNRTAAAVVPALLAFTVPFVAISTCERTESPNNTQTELRIAATDIEALCRDWLYYRKKVIQYTVAGETANAERARARLRQLNSMLNEVPQSSVNAAFLRLEEDGYKP
jgi:hypothetical protein